MTKIISRNSTTKKNSVPSGKHIKMGTLSNESESVITVQILGNDPVSELSTETALSESTNLTPSSLDTNTLPRKIQFPFYLPGKFELGLGQNDLAYSVFHDQKNDYVLQIGSREMDLRIRMVAEDIEGKMLRRSDIAEINEYLQAWTEMHGERLDVFYRVRPIEGGVELDVGDAMHTRIRITASKVEVL